MSQKYRIYSEVFCLESNKHVHNQLYKIEQFIQSQQILKGLALVRCVAVENK
jgi:hypothetical protein